MTIENGYITLAELRAAFVPSGVTSTAADGRYEQVIEAASRTVENYCQRRFYGVPETRYYMADGERELFIFDLTSLTALKTDDDGDGTFETTWQATDYNLFPYNAALDAKPYTSIETNESGTQTFPIGVKKGVLVQGQFGYVAGTNAAASCPAPVHDATLLLTIRYLERKDVVLGVAGNTQLGEQRVVVPSWLIDGDIRAMLDPFRRLVK